MVSIDLVNNSINPLNNRIQGMLEVKFTKYPYRGIPND